MTTNQATEAIRDAATLEGVRVALVDALSVAGRFDLAGMRAVVAAADDRLYEIAVPDWRKPTGKAWVQL